MHSSSEFHRKPPCPILSKIQNTLLHCCNRYSGSSLPPPLLRINTLLSPQTHQKKLRHETATQFTARIPRKTSAVRQHSNGKVDRIQVTSCAQLTVDSLYLIMEPPPISQLNLRLCTLISQPCCRYGKIFPICPGNTVTNCLLRHMINCQTIHKFTDTLNLSPVIGTCKTCALSDARNVLSV